MQTPPDIPDDEISLYDLWRVLIRRKAWVLGFPLFAIIAAAITVTFMKPQWEAMALIRIGEVGQVGQRLIEPVAQAVERMKLKTFKDAVLINIGLPTDDKNSESTLYRDSLQAKNLRGVDLIELKVRGYTQASAMRFVDATIDYLKKSHNERAVSEVQWMRQTLERTDKEIAQTKAELDKLDKLTDLRDKERFMENVVLTNNIIKLDETLRSLNQAKTNNEAQLGPMHTFPTSVIEKISLSDKPVAPKKVLIILMAGVFGLLAGVGAAFLDHARARRAIGNAV
jgi:LPS O-antigen subunit length determinant protein (WzzB/FepE family)